MSVSIAIAYHSGFGHTERQARAVASGRRAGFLGARVATVALQVVSGRAALVGA